MSEDIAANMTLADWVEKCGYEAEVNGWHDRWHLLQEVAENTRDWVHDMENSVAEGLSTEGELENAKSVLNDDDSTVLDHLIAKTALVGCEVSEAIEELRNGHAPDEVYVHDADPLKKPEGYGVELADVVIRVFDLAYMLNIDLTHIMEDKLRANERRGQMHGGKKI